MIYYDKIYNGGSWVVSKDKKLIFPPQGTSLTQEQAERWWYNNQNFYHQNPLDYPNHAVKLTKKPFSFLKFFKNLLSKNP